MRENIDGGIEPDYTMLRDPGDGEVDYTDLYDLEYIDAKMNELFPAETESTPEESKAAESEGRKADSSPATGAACTGGILAVIIFAGDVSAKKHGK